MYYFQTENYQKANEYFLKINEFKEKIVGSDDFFIKISII